MQPAALTTFTQRSAQFLCAACAPRHKTQHIASFAHSQPSSCKRLRTIVHIICLRVGCRRRVQRVLLVRSGATPKLFSNNSDTHDRVTIADSWCLSIPTPVAADDQCRTQHTHGAVRCQRLSGMGRRARVCACGKKKERRAVGACMCVTARGRRCIRADSSSYAAPARLRSSVVGAVAAVQRARREHRKNKFIALAQCSFKGELGEGSTHEK